MNDITNNPPNQKDVLSFINFFIDFCKSEEAVYILERYIKLFKRKPVWKLEDAQKYLKIYKNSLLISTYMKNFIWVKDYEE